jgi:WD40 repeat protein
MLGRGRFSASLGHSDRAAPWSGLQVWDGATLEILRAMIGAESAIEMLSRFTPAGGEGVTIVAGESNGRVWLWDPEAGEESRALVGPTGCISPLACLEPTSFPHERWVASAGKDGVVRLWEAEGGRMVHALSGHTGLVRALLAFKEPEAGRDRVVSGGMDRTIRVWDAESGQALHVMRVEDQIRQLLVFPTAEGPCLVSSTFKGLLHTWRPADGRLVRRLDHNADAYMASLLLFETRGEEATGGGWRQRLAVGGESHCLVWDLGEAVPSGSDVVRPAHKLG